MKIRPILLFVFLPLLAYGEKASLTGTFESVPFFEMADMPDSVTEKMRASAEKTKQILVITDTDMTLKVGMGGGLYMTYTITGEFLLGKTMLGSSTMYYPAYIKDKDTLFMMGQKFIRKAPEGE